MARRAFSTVTVAVAIAAMYLIWPTQLGGRTSYVITSGVSMEPVFRSGDLAVLRRANQYGVGEIAGYRSRSMGVTVLHRIVERRGARAVFQGDHNTWRDADEPTEADILGRLVLRIPHGGWALRLASQPAVLLFAGGLVTIAGSRQRRRNRRRSHPPPVHSGVGRPAEGRRPALGRPPRALLVGVAGLGLALLLVGAAAWTVPSRIRYAASLPVQHRVTLSYRAIVPPSAVYPSGTLQFPDPVFLRLVPALEITVGADVGPALARHVDGLAGSYTVVADLRGTDGWRRSFVLQAETPFSGTAFQTTTPLPLARFVDVIKEVHRLTGTSGGPLSLTVTTEVTLTGSVAGARFDRALTPALAFDLDPEQLRLKDRAGGGATGVVSSGSWPVPVPGEATRRLPLPGHPSVPVVRTLAPTLASVALVGAAALARLPPRPLPEPRSVQIPRRYRRRIIEARDTTIPSDRTVTTVDSIATLHRIAERYDRLIVHSRSVSRHTFLVHDDAAVYLFVADLPAPRPRPAEESLPDRVPAPRHASR